MTAQLSIVVAAAENGAIGKGNQMPWRLPDDLKYFKAVTLGKPIVMGRKTFESIGRPLPGRRNIVISRQPGLAISECVVVNSIAAALAAAGDVPEIMIVGGADLYRQVLPMTHRVYLTRVHTRLEADVYFPDLPEAEWRETHRVAHAADERHAYSFTFLTLERAS